MLLTCAASPASDAEGGAGWADVGGFLFPISSDEALGIYARGGAGWLVGERFELGFDLRVVQGPEVDLGFEKLDLSYLQVAALGGWRF